jgi:myo-inositol-1-phosphate synthase
MKELIEYKFHLLEHSYSYELLITPKLKNNFELRYNSYYIKIEESEKDFIKKIKTEKEFDRFYYLSSDINSYDFKLRKNIYKIKSTIGEDLSQENMLYWKLRQDEYKHDFMEKPEEEILAELEQAKTELLEEYLQMLEDTRIAENEKHQEKIKKENNFNRILQHLGI